MKIYIGIFYNSKSFVPVADISVNYLNGCKIHKKYYRSEHYKKTYNY